MREIIIGKEWTMGRIFKSVKPYWKSIILILALLVIQAYCDLSLPQYTSDIIDTGIQNGGVSHVMPEAVTKDEFEFAKLLMTEEEKSVWEESYDADESVYRLNVKSESKLTEYDDMFAIPLIMNNQMNEEQRNSLKAVSAMGGISQEQLLALRDKMEESVETVGSSLIKSMGISYALKQDKLAGLDMDKIQTQYLIIAGLKMVAMALILALITVLVGLIASRVGAGIGRDLRCSIYKNVMNFSNSETDKFSTASLITRTTNDVQQIQMVSVMMLRLVAYAPIIGIGGIIKVSETGAGMGWVIGLAVLVIMMIVMVLMVIAMPKFKLMQKLVDRVNLVSREILTGLSVIRAFGREQKEEQRFDEANTKLTKTMLFTNRVMTFMMPLMTMVMNGLTVLIVWVAAHNIDEGTMQVGAMTAFITYAMQIVMSFLMLTMMSIMLPRAAVAGERIDEVLNTKSSINDVNNPEKLNENKGVVSFNHVSFRYPGAEADVISDIDFVAEPGKTTAIIGSTGCGKSTLVNLIPRLYDVTSGSITVDGHDIRNVSIKELRDNIGYVPQKAMLFSGTIESNLRYGNVDATEEEIAQAAEIAQAKDFIEEKRDKYRSNIAQGGSNVSGGQKQRLSIARAIAKNPKIYIFDDSFSALDLKTDSALRKALAPKVKDSTVIIVAQRISTVLHAEQILVMEDGKIAGKGTHEQLLANCEVYRQIAKSQMSAKELGLNETENDKKEEA